MTVGRILLKRTPVVVAQSPFARLLDEHIAPSKPAAEPHPTATASGRINRITEQIVREHLAALGRALGRAAAREAMADQTAAKRSIPSKSAKEI